MAHVLTQASIPRYIRVSCHSAYTWYTASDKWKHADNSIYVRYLLTQHVHGLNTLGFSVQCVHDASECASGGTHR